MVAILRYQRLINGERITVSADEYDDIIDNCQSRERIGELASCQNSKRVGVMDGYVAWIGKENKPSDLVLFANGSFFAEGSAT